jgi:hypothetical protein
VCGQLGVTTTRLVVGGFQRSTSTPRKCQTAGGKIVRVSADRRERLCFGALVLVREAPVKAQRRKARGPPVHMRNTHSRSKSKYISSPRKLISSKAQESGYPTARHIMRCITRPKRTLPRPHWYTAQVGAGIWVPYGTAYHALYHSAKAHASETTLVHGASGGVGIAAH